jgi:hypothetical protein
VRAWVTRWRWCEWGRSRALVVWVALRLAAGSILPAPSRLSQRKMKLSLDRGLSKRGEKLVGPETGDRGRCPGPHGDSLPGLLAVEVQPTTDHGLVVDVSPGGVSSCVPPVSGGEVGNVLVFFFNEKSQC